MSPSSGRKMESSRLLRNTGTHLPHALANYNFNVLDYIWEMEQKRTNEKERQIILGTIHNYCIPPFINRNATCHVLHPGTAYPLADIQLFGICKKGKIVPVLN
jgi:hypothetical protein